MIKKILPAVLLASTFIINHGHTMEIDNDKIQTLKSKMTTPLAEIYNKPKDQRKAYIDHVCTDPEENDKLEIDECINLIKKESQLDYFSIKINIESLNRTKESQISFMIEHSQDLPNKSISKGQAEQSMKDFLIHAENHACLFAAPNSSAEQLDQVKKVFTKYLEDYYNITNIDTKTRISQSTLQQQAQHDHQYSLYDSFLDNLSTTLNVEKFSLNGNKAIQEINKFQLLYLKEKTKENSVLWQCNFAQNNLNEEQKKLLHIENKIKALETPLYLFLDDLDSIERIL